MTNDYIFTYGERIYTIRSDMIDALQRYVQRGLPPGDFLQAVLAHDLMEACQRADGGNLDNLPAYAAYLYNKIPGGCHGSRERVEQWIKRGGLNAESADRPE